MTSLQECRKRGGDDPGEVRLILGDCLDVLRSLDSASVDAVVTDPPAGISFMGKDWDTFGGRSNPRAEADRTAGNRGFGAGLGNQPFGYSGSALPRRGERAAFVVFIVEVLAECLRVAKPGSILLCWSLPRTSHWTGTAIEDAGWIIEDRIAHHFGSGFPKHKSKLKPATEDWWVARKPGGAKWLNVDGCRVGTSEDCRRNPSPVRTQYGFGRNLAMGGNGHPAGRWPANLVLSHSPGCNGTCVEGCPIRLMGEQGGERKCHKPYSKRRSNNLHCYGDDSGRIGSDVTGYDDSGSAARFFANFDADPFIYCPKASTEDRGAGNTHPTCKSTELMRWLCRLATPEGGTVLDPFMGSGSTGVAAVQLGFSFVGIEQSTEDHECAIRRIGAEQARYSLFPETSRVVMSVSAHGKP